MGMKTKRFLAVLLCALILVNLVPASVFAGEESFQFVYIWLNGDGTILDRQTYGTIRENPSTGKTPTKAEDDNYSYVFDHWVESCSEADTTATFTYTPSFNRNPIKKHTLTISYVFEDGRPASETYTAKLKERASYRVDSPKIESFLPDQPAVSGSMGTSDVNVKVTYKATRVASIKFSKGSYTAVYEQSANISVVIKDQTGQVKPGKEVVCKIAGVLPKRQTTDANGKVTFSTFSLLNPGSYIVKMECDGIFAETHLQVLKATVRLDAKGKNFKNSKRTKNYKYTVKLKSIVDKKGIKGERLYLKINGKTYKATTDAKGKATFKISKLKKKGKYTATISLTDNPFYNDIIKKVKIRIV